MRVGAGLVLAVALGLAGPVWGDGAPPDPAAEARVWTVEAMLGRETVARASFNPGGTHVVFERERGWRTAALYDPGVMTPWMLRDLWLVSVESDGEPERVCGGEAEGCLAGPWSPSGRKAIVWRVTLEALQAGVLDLETRAIRWLPLHPDIPVFGETVVWVDEDRLIAVHRLDGPLPYHFGWERTARADTARDWLRAQQGDVATAVVWGTAPFDRDLDRRPEAELVELDLKDPTRDRRSLWRGRFWDMSLSLDGASLAVMEAGPRFRNVPGRSPSPSGRAWRRTLTLIDRATGRSQRPLEDRPVAASLLSWSEGGRLLAHTLGEDGKLDGGALVSVSLDAPTTEWPIEGLTTDTARHPLADPTLVRALWRGETPIVAARRNGEARVDWYRLASEGPAALTAAFESPPGAFAASWPDGLVMIGDGVAWLVEDDGRRRRLEGTEGAQTSSFLGLWDAPRLRWNPRPPTGDLTLMDGDQAIRLSPTAGDPAIERWTAAGRLMDLAGGRHLATERRGGALTLRMGGVGDQDRILAALNPTLADIAFVEPLPIRHAGPAGEALVSWLWPAIGVEGPAPVVVAAYPGSSTPDVPGAAPYGDPAGRGVVENPQLLAAAGYAVLQPSLPGSGFPTGGQLADQLHAVVDAVAAAHADKADVGRLAYLGHSFGGWGGLEMATRSDRFDAVIVAAAPSNLTQMWGEFPPWVRGAPRYGDGYQFQQGWTEVGQGGVGGPPWETPDAYVAASPFFRADRVKAPVLMLHGDREPALAQAEALYSAFWRLNHPARLVVYRGEGHLLASPANLIHAHGEIIGFLDQVFGTSRDAPAPPSAAPSSPQGPP